MSLKDTQATLIFNTAHMMPARTHARSHSALEHVYAAKPEQKWIRMSQEAAYKDVVCVCVCVCVFCVCVCVGGKQDLTVEAAAGAEHKVIITEPEDAGKEV
jgi:hypothetical protein